MRIFRSTFFLFMLVFLAPSFATADSYISASLGSLLYTNNGPPEYYSSNKYGLSGQCSSYTPLRLSLMGGTWFNEVWGAELSFELGPFTSGSGGKAITPTSPNYKDHLGYNETQDFGGLLFAPQARMGLIPEKLVLVLALPIGWQFLIGKSEYQQSNYGSSYYVHASTWAVGANARLELTITERLYLSFSLGYLYAKFPNVSYSYAATMWESGAWGMANSYYRNDGLDVSSVRASLGIGFRWGLWD